jgi:hypothetical protein
MSAALPRFADHTVTVAVLIPAILRIDTTAVRAESVPAATSGVGVAT